MFLPSWSEMWLVLPVVAEKPPTDVVRALVAFYGVHDLGWVVSKVDVHRSLGALYSDLTNIRGVRVSVFGPRFENV